MPRLVASASRPLSSEPNLTPMIDVLLVVIIVFMMAMVRVNRSMDAVLPQPCTVGCDASPPIILEVLEGPRYRINRRDVSGPNLLSELRGIYAGRPEKIIQVAGHSGVRYSDVVEAMDIAKSAGVRVIGVDTKEVSGGR